jgi:hypothetical protein
LHARSESGAAAMECDDAAAAPAAARSAPPRAARVPSAPRTTGTRRSRRVSSASGGVAATAAGAATPTAADGADVLAALLGSRAAGLPPTRLVFHAPGAAEAADAEEDADADAGAGADAAPGGAGADKPAYKRKDHSLRTLCQARRLRLRASLSRFAAFPPLRCVSYFRSCVSHFPVLPRAHATLLAALPPQRFFSLYAHAAAPVSIADAATQLDVKARRIYGACTHHHSLRCVPLSLALILR